MPPTPHRHGRTAGASGPRPERFAELLGAFGLARRPVRSRRTPARGSEAAPDFTALVASLHLEAIDELLEVIRTRELHDTPYPYVHVDMIPSTADMNGRRADLVTATGVTAEGDFEPLGFSSGDVSERDFREGFVCDLSCRGLRGVRVVGSPDIEGLRAALRRMLPGVRWRLSGPIDSLTLDQALRIIREGER